jgi:hypothetical protein
MSPPTAGHADIVCHFVQTCQRGQLLAGGGGVRHHQLQALHRPGLHLALAGQVAEDDRAARAARRQLHHVHVLVPGVVVQLETDLVAVERERAVDVADGKDDDLAGRRR